ncbi:hypothetical protein [Paracoccus salsus]|uniref:hypothetical protein n=1 Tax=Paracoccus salsus TaxID=2911061 RepID=UPI001F321794|nr:hypothetical protein [Paracoccus salsus]MCF3974104.1 hypothetical protein [Paracoccus salsus]
MRAGAILLSLLSLAAAVSACGPVPVAQAEASCLRDAELASRPRGDARIGIGTDGDGNLRSIGQINVAISSDYMAGRDPSEVFNRCVVRRSGQFPTRALYDQPGWRG